MTTTGKVSTPWPESPVHVSPIEGIIESFWNPALEAPTRWICEGGDISTFWDACFFNIRLGTTTEGGAFGSGSISRSYNLEIDSYDRLRIRIRPGLGVTTTVTATIDGSESVIARRQSTVHGAIELVGDISGRSLTGLDIAFEIQGESLPPAPENDFDSAEPVHAVQLRWVMLERDGERWVPPAHPYADYLANDPGDRFEPGLGLIFGAPELEKMRTYVSDPLFEEVWREDLKAAEIQNAVDPASMIRQYSLYAHTRYGRPWDRDVDTGCDGLLLALVGMITRNSDYLRQAAKHALVFAHIDEWAEGFVDRMPGYFWYHSNFAPNVATIKVSLLLDWTWDWLSPEGRDFIRDAIRTKGLARLDGAETRMANQGVRFVKGIVLGTLAVAADRKSSELRSSIRRYLDALDTKLETISNSDGTFSEGMGYGTGTMASVPITYVAASRCLDTPVHELVSPLFLRSMRFVLTARNGIAPTFAAFCAGPLGDPMFEEQCVPTSVFAAYTTPEREPTSGNSSEYVFYGLAPLWCAPKSRTPAPLKLPGFTLFSDGGWIYLGNDDAAEPRLSFESGLWDGHGHSWYHKHALTVDAWDERILVTRHHLSYEDARSRSTMSTRFYNTFAPSGRDQDATGTPGRGAVLKAAEDLGAISIIESDNATSWNHNIKRAVRRVIFIRPSVIVVDDILELDEAETGVLSWNGFAEWESETEYSDMPTAVLRIGRTGARISAASDQNLSMSVGEASVHNENGVEWPMYRAAWTTSEDIRLRVISLIEVINPDGSSPEISFNGGDGADIEVSDQDLRICICSKSVEREPLLKCSTDGELLVVVQKGNGLTRVVAFGAGYLETPIGTADRTGAAPLIVTSAE